MDRQVSFVVKMTTGLSLGRLVGIFKAEKPDRNGHLGGGWGGLKMHRYINDIVLFEKL